MILLDWFRTRDVDEFADALVADVRRRFPPTGIEARGSKHAERIHKIHGALMSQIEGFAKGTPLSLYRKARLGNRVKWALKDAGYPDRFVDAFVHELLETTVTARGRGMTGNERM